MSAIASRIRRKDIPSAVVRSPLPDTTRCLLCGLTIDRRVNSRRNNYCSTCARERKREQQRLAAAGAERERILDAIRDVTREGRNRRDALSFIEEFQRLYHGPIGLAARLLELDADLKERGDLANQVRLFEAVLAVLSRASVTD